MFLVILSVTYRKNLSLDELHILTPNSDKCFNMRKPNQWKPLVITTCRHCSWKPNDDSQLSHFGRQSGLQILKRQTSRRWLASYRSWEPNDDRSLSHYDCQSGLPVNVRRRKGLSPPGSQLRGACSTERLAEKWYKRSYHLVDGK